MQAQSTVGPLPFNVDAARLRIRRLECLANDEGRSVLLRFEHDPASNIVKVVRGDRRPATFIMEPGMQAIIPQLPYSKSLLFKVELDGSESDSLLFAIGKGLKDMKRRIGEHQVEEVRSKECEFVWDAQGGAEPLSFVFMRETKELPEILSGLTLWIMAPDLDFFETSLGPPAPSPISPRNADILPYSVPSQVPMTPASTRPGTAHAFVTEDGPHFRSALVSMERRIPSLRARTKLILKRALVSREQLETQIEADSQLAASIYEAASYEFPEFKPVSDWYNNHTEGGLSSIRRQRKVWLNELSSRIIEPLQKYYDYDIKSFEQRKREFDEESNQFYSWTSRYLANRKEGKHAKFGAKKQAFDVARFDYFNYLCDLTIGLKKQVLLQLLTLATQSSTDSHIALGKELASRTQPQFDVVVEDIKAAAKLWETYRQKNMQFRKSLIEYVDDDRQTSPGAGTPGGAASAAVAAAAAVNAGAGGAAAVAAAAAGSAGAGGAGNAGGSSSTSGAASGASSGETGSGAAHSVPATPIGPSQESSVPFSPGGDPTQGDPTQGATPVPTYYKEGLLWASSRPGGHQETPVSNKQGLQNLKWHKYWVVLDGSSLREYSNWKQSYVDLHNEPINLLMASVREARNGDRRFCFEVVTPQYKRVYQATCEEDVRAWISAINKSVSSLLGEEPPASPPIVSPTTSGVASFAHALAERSQGAGAGPMSPKPHGTSNNSGIGSPTIPRSPSSHSSLSGARLVSSPSVRGDRPRIAVNTSLPSNKPAPVPVLPHEDILHAVQRIPSDRHCAECGSTQSVEWVSINLMVVICIECSGAHRSLGSHISKVRSLTLDTGAFTASFNKALLSVSNDTINQIWEQKLPLHRKISPDSSSAARKKYVTEKYVEKQFIQEVEKPNAVLRRAIREYNVPLMCAALASRANPNSVSDSDEPLIIDALRSAGDATAFPIAAVLVKNGATAPPVGSYKELSSAAEQYLAVQRASK